MTVKVRMRRTDWRGWLLRRTARALGFGVEGMKLTHQETGQLDALLVGRDESAITASALHIANSVEQAMRRKYIQALGLEDVVAAMLREEEGEKKEEEEEDSALKQAAALNAALPPMGNVATPIFTIRGNRRDEEC